MKTLNLSQQSAFLFCSIVAYACSPASRAQTLTLEQALDTTNLVWTTGGDAAWFGQTTNSYDGNGAACSVLAAAGQVSWLETTVTGPATLSFWSEVIDDATFPAFPSGMLGLAINPGAIGGPGGPGPGRNGYPYGTWTQASYDLPEGTCVLRWTFELRPYTTNDLARAFVDQVMLGPARPLQITYHPVDQTVYSREMAFVWVGVIGTPPYAYQWLKDGTNIPGATNASWFAQSASTNDSGVYEVLVNNSQCFLRSSNAVLTVLPPTPPIPYPPTDETVYSGQVAEWWGNSSGSPPFTYQWRKNGTNLPGATAAILSITNVQTTDAGSYSFEVSNTEGSAISSNAVLTVLPSAAPVITAQPCSLNVAAGASLALTAQASGMPAPQYQWVRNGTNLPGAISSSLSFTNVTAGDAGVYSVRVANFLGVALSHDAILRVLPPLSAVGSWFQGVNNVTVTDGLAFLAQGDDGVGVLNVADPANPFMIGGCNTPGQALVVRVVGNLAYVADGFAGLAILSVTNPANPAKLGSYDTPGYAQDVSVVGSLAYVADGDAGLQILDVSNPAQPLRVGGFVTNMSAASVRVLGNLAYVGCPTVVSEIGHPMSQGLQIIDVSNPSQPALLGSTFQDAAAVDVQGTLALTAGLNSALWLFDVSNPAAPNPVGSFAPPPPPPPPFVFPGQGASDVQLAGNLAYVTFGTNGLWVVDVSSPSAPVNVGRFTTTAAAQKVAVFGNTAYVALGDGGLQIVSMPSGLGVQPSPALSLSHENGLRLALTGPAGAQATIEWSDSLTAGQWQRLQTMTLGNAPVVLDVTGVAVAHRFFRARLSWP